MLKLLRRSGALRSTIRITGNHCNFAAAASQQMAVIKALRDRSGAPISDVKAALVETNWDMDSAFNALRKKGLAAATKKASRHAAEGLVGVSQAQHSATIVEVNCETDFVSRNPAFISLVQQVAAAAQTSSTSAEAGRRDVDIEALKAAHLVGSASVGEAVLNLAGSVRENIQIRRAVRLCTGGAGVVGCYVHGACGEGVGRIVGAVALGGEGMASVPEEGLMKVKEMCNKLAMHVVAAKPGYLDKGSVPEAALEAERSVLRDQARSSGKPEAIINKMVEGRMSKFYEEQCLMQQKFVVDETVRIQDIVKRIGSDLGFKSSITGFVRLQCGEGLDQQVGKDFAAEVAEVIHSAC